MGFKDLGDWAQIGGLSLPIQGKTYHLPPVSAELGPRLQVILSVGVDLKQGRTIGAEDQQVLDDLGERNLYRDILGPVYDQMVADGVPWPALKHAALTSMFDAVVDRETAEQFWQSEGKASARARSNGAASNGSARAKPTKRASTAGTTSRRTTAGKAKATGGRKSSATGR